MMGVALSGHQVRFNDAMTTARKLQIPAAATVVVLGGPSGVDLDIPADCPVTSDPTDAAEAGAVIAFLVTGADLDTVALPALAAARADRLAWVAYPKARQLGTDLNRDVLAGLGVRAWRAAGAAGLPRRRVVRAALPARLRHCIPWGLPPAPRARSCRCRPEESPVPFFTSTQHARAERLSGLDRFATLTPKDVRRVVKAAQLARVKRNERVTSEGSGADGLYIVVSGTLKVAQDGEEIRTLRAGDMIGEIALLTGSVSTASVRADSESEVLFFPHEVVARLCEEIPPFRVALEATAGDRLQADRHRE